MFLETQTNQTERTQITHIYGQITFSFCKIYSPKTWSCGTLNECINL